MWINKHLYCISHQPHCCFTYVSTYLFCWFRIFIIMHIYVCTIMASGKLCLPGFRRKTGRTREQLLHSLPVMTQHCSIVYHFTCNALPPKGMPSELMRIFSHHCPACLFYFAVFFFSSIGCWAFSLPLCVYIFETCFCSLLFCCCCCL